MSGRGREVQSMVYLYMAGNLLFKLWLGASLSRSVEGRLGFNPKDLSVSTHIRASQFLKILISFFLEAIRLCVDLI